MRCSPILACVWAALTAAASGCGQRPLSVAEGLQSELPPERVAACIRAAEQHDTSVVPLLVERLEDSAADVRFFAILALKRVTGQTLGYNYHDRPEERLEAVCRWRRWLKDRPASGKGG